MLRLVDDLLLFAAFLALTAFIYVRRPSLPFLAALTSMIALVKLGDIFVDAPLDALVPRTFREFAALIWLLVTVIGISTIVTLQARRLAARMPPAEPPVPPA